MDIKVSAKYLRISPKKMIPLARLVSSKGALEAIEILKYVPKKGSMPLVKLINSAIANAKNNFNLKEDNLYISSISVNQGSVFKRVKFRGRGGRDIIKKRTTHLYLTLSEIKPSLEPVKKKEVKKIEPKVTEEAKLTSKEQKEKPQVKPKTKTEGIKAKAKVKEVKSEKEISEKKPSLPKEIKKEKKLTFRERIFAKRKFFRRKSG